jgi:hypothetical protein
MIFTIFTGDKMNSLIIFGLLIMTVIAVMALINRPFSENSVKQSDTKSSKVPQVTRTIQPIGPTKTQKDDTARLPDNYTEMISTSDQALSTTASVPSNEQLILYCEKGILALDTLYREKRIQKNRYFQRKKILKEAIAQFETATEVSISPK